MELYPVLCASLDGSRVGVGEGGMDTCIYITESLHCLPETVTTLLIGYSVQFSRSVMSNSLWLHGLQHTRLPCPSPTLRAYSDSCPLSRWCHPTTSPSVIPFSSCLQSFPVFSNEHQSSEDYFFPFSIVLINSGSFHFPYLKKKKKEFIEILFWIALNLYIKLGRTEILTTLSLPMHGHGILLHLFIFSLTFCNQSCASLHIVFVHILIQLNLCFIFCVHI